VRVGVSVAGRVAGVEDGLAVREAVLTGGATTGVSSLIMGDNVIDGIKEGVEVDSMTLTGSCS
jgi:hypothetical protein